MNWQQVNELDFDNIGQWPRAAKVIAILLVCALLAGAVGYFFIKDSLARLDRTRAQEQQLRAAFEEKARQAAGLPAYQEQLAALQKQLETQLRKLPNSLEIAGLLDDISFIATDNGLHLERINWEPEKRGEFSTELPMRIVVSGDYHQLGHFVADVAALPRIVIIDSFTLSRSGGGLNMSMLAKTYKYNKAEAP
ncbi:pilus assembly protein PilP [Zobellella denitrificans]|jgi:type IV pilus assembly protein PilO|uniref:Pilus assembly protein PilP n=1 Tax=Zobellella denitrificans TaxID=347534 RepID=A0A231MXU9_9GAMM|nr:type 4a pilus biogenesis protein PilO [Zobellella denitrificans]ATG75091.1 pilus assembly protein PilP [Zobellella denitrificans]OXS14870.1 pilus assembly protein PilP [Zobellella denitrificans]